jgi:putative transposase
MISPSERHQGVELIDAARASAARGKPACQALGIDIRPYQRWTRAGGIKTDTRPGAGRPVPVNQLGTEECAQGRAICPEPAYASLPPSQIVPRLAEEARARGLRIDLLPHSSGSR